MTTLKVSDGPKMLRETLCRAQAAIGQTYTDTRVQRDISLLGRLIDECDRHRPVGPDGKHDDRHTLTCGCDTGLDPVHDNYPDPVEPDRPEPVDPASVRVGQVVEIEAHDGSWMVRGTVEQLDRTDSHKPIRVQAWDRPEPVDPESVRVGDVVEIEAPTWGVWGEVVIVGVSSFGGPQWSIYFGGHDAWHSPAAGATVRILRPAEPDPDPAAVEALAELLDSLPPEMPSQNKARELIRDGVRVVNNDG